jgi:glucans biosynthesis protein C
MVLFFMKDSGRMYGLDALRGVAMTLGIFLHGSIAYKQGYHYGNWVLDTEFTSWFFDWLYLWINSFRMQTFFLLAGLFARVLINKTGLLEFTLNRLKRIGLVLLISYFTILPLTLAPYLWVVEFNDLDGWKQLLDFFGRFYTLEAHYGFMHLWFLQHLLVYYGLFITTLYIFIKLNSKPVGLNKPGIGLSVFNFMLISVAVLGILSQFFETALPSIWTGFIIPIPQLAYYLFFFVLGWWLENRRNLFRSFEGIYKSFVIVGTCLNFLVLYFLNSEVKVMPAAGLKFLFAIQTMLLIIGFIGLFNAKFKSLKPFWKYVADAAYWVYLIHMPIVLTTQLLLLNTAVPGFLRFPIVILTTIVTSFGTYHLLIRYSWAGTLLNGARTRN